MDAKTLSFALIACCCLAMAGPLGAQESPKPDATPKAAAPQIAPPDRGEGLVLEQEQIADRFKRLESALLRMAELTAQEDPRRAALLRQAVEHSKGEHITVRLETIAKLLEQEQLFQATKEQSETHQNLVKLLELLLSEDRANRLESDKARIRQYLARLNRMIKDQKDIQSQTPGASEADRLAEAQGGLAKKAGELAKDMQSNEPGAAGSDADKSNQNDKPDPKDAKNADGSKKDADKSGDAKQAKDKQPGGDKDQSSRRPSGDKNQKQDGKQDGQKQDGKQDGENQDGKPSDGKPSGDKQDGKPSSEKKSGEKQPGEKKSGEKQSGEKQDGQPSGEKSEGRQQDQQDGQQQPGQQGQQGGQPQNPGEQDQQQDEQQQSDQNQPTAPEGSARKRIQSAQQRMEEAKKKLEEAQRKQAVDKQEQALRELEQAKADLEEILRQLREEEIERMLTLLEARFRKMLEMQQEVYEGTRRIDDTAEVDRDRDSEIEAGRLSRKESAIIVEADKALVLMREEGSAVAFPEAVVQMRDDMEQVVNRLSHANTGKLTQGIEEEIIRALEEMIAALKQAQKDAKQRQQMPMQQQQSEQNEDPLVDRIAELKMIKALQLRVNTRHDRYSKLVEGEQAADPEVVDALLRLKEREERIHRTTRDIVIGKNR